VGFFHTGMDPQKLRGMVADVILVGAAEVNASEQIRVFAMERSSYYLQNRRKA